ncbi:MAG: PAC2 family protein [Candidatus Bathyarchaeota archaeon]
MDKPRFVQIFEPQLENPILVEGLAGLGNIGMIAARHLIECTDAKPFAEVYAPYFPDYVTVNKDGTCRPPRYIFYVAKTEKNHYIILTGDAQPAMEDGLAHYDICDELLNFVAKYGTTRIITLGGVVSSNATNEVYIAATSEALAKKHLNKGTTIYRDGKIIGPTGLLIGLAKKRVWKGICLLGATSVFGTERAAALSIYKVLKNMLEPDSKILQAKVKQKPRS